MSDLAKKIGIARTTHPTASLNSQDIKATFDKVGRQVMTLYQARELTSSGSAN